MKKLFLLLLLLAPLTFAQTGDDRGWLLGCEVGISQIDLPEDDEEGMGGIFGGYRFNRYLGIEAGFNHFATFESGEVLRRGERHEVEKSIDGARIMVMGMLPVSDQFSFFGKLGVFHGFETEIIDYDDDDDDYSIKHDEDDTGPAIEAGFLFKIHPRWEMVFSAGRYSASVIDFNVGTNNGDITIEGDGDEIDFVKVGVAYKFGRRL